MVSADNIKVTTNTDSELQQQTASFHSNNELYTTDPAGERDESFNSSNTDNVPLSQFLSRPARIHQQVWNVADREFADFCDGIDPWVLWQSDPRVVDKISNFAYANFDLKLRIVINGSRFQYGKLMAVYVPYGDTTTSGGVSSGNNQIFREIYKVFKALPNGVSDAASARQALLQYLSTYPHVMLHPGVNNVAELVLPFIWHLNYINLNGNENAAKESLGKLFFIPMNALRCAKTEANAPAKITVFAWAEKLNLVMPTEIVPTSSYSSFGSGEMHFSKKSGSKDEYPGPVSSVASNVSSVAGKLTKVPVIGNFAKATEIGAGSVAKIAKLFGFSSPTDDRGNTLAKLNTHGRLATTSGIDSSLKLTLDPKQELSVDPRVCGVHPNDEMVFTSIATREQYIGQSMWFVEGGQDASNPDLIFSSLVSPHQINRAPNAAVISNRTYEYATNTPAGYLASSFAYWRGSITYRVEVIASPFHSGRLKLQFDPSVSFATLTTSDLVADDVNARFTMILDLEDDREAEFTIPYCNPRPYLRCQDDLYKNTFRPAHLQDTTQDVASNFDSENYLGVFTVSVVNSLVSPNKGNRGDVQNNDTAPAYVNIFFKMNDDFELCQPDVASGWQNNYFGPFSASEGFGSGESHFDAIESKQFDAYTPTDLNTVFFGEKIVSLRSLCKRQTIAFMGGSGNAAGNNAQYTGRRIPLYPPNTIHDKKRSNTFCSYYMPAFLCVRGGQRYKFCNIAGHDNNVSDINNGYMVVERRGTKGKTVNWSEPGTMATPNNLQNALPKGFGGSAYTYFNYNPTLEFESPFYSNTRFYCGPNFYNMSNSGLEPLIQNSSMEQILYTELFLVAMDTDVVTQVLYCGAAEDFSMSFFLGVPPIWKYTAA